MTRALDTAKIQQNSGGSVAPFIAGKNKIINGDFGIWQRGTSGFATGGAYNADRWRAYCDGPGATYSITQQPLASGSIPGVDSQYCWQLNQSVAGSGGTQNLLYQLVENVQTLQGQSAVLSFYAKSDATRTMLSPVGSQYFGSGGSSTAVLSFTPASSTPTNLTTSWQRFIYTVNIPSTAGKTLGTNHYLEINIKLPINTTQVTQIVGVQLEAGTQATPFTIATGTIQGELAACQRYYWRNTVPTATKTATGIVGRSTTVADAIIQFPVTMRTNPSAVEYGGGTLVLTEPGVNAYNITSIAFVHASYQTAFIQPTTASGLSVGKVYSLDVPTNGYLGFSAEL